MESLVLTLGHNSSAVLVRDGHIVAGYETERFTGKKSDSSYPAMPIERLHRDHGIDHNAQIMIGHWFLDANLPSASNKYLNYEHLKSVVRNGEIHSLDKEFSHHDSHVESGIAFAGQDFAPNYHAFVMDGFGSFGECISVYEVNQAGSYVLKARWFGYEKSLGMLYQYATAYMGMKQHNHEYKILAYEVHASKFNDVDAINDYAYEAAAKHIRSMIVGQMDSTYDPMISLEALPRIQMAISDELDRFCDEFNVDKDNELEFRSCVSLYVQTFVEAVAMSIVQLYRPQNALLVGGLFYNVKLNNLVSKQVPGRICVMPLAGDQGAGLGVYNRYHGDLVWPGHLAWGNRDLSFVSDEPGIITVPNMEAAKDVIVGEINRIGFVNVVRGAMEFGPRALCNTTTLALPDIGVCAQINQCNGRTTEMPMAPVLSRDAARRVFAGTDKWHKSLEYMIATCDYNPGEGVKYSGAAHYYPEYRVHTGRPQITGDQDLLDIMSRTNDVLVNTSFNYHGQPIVFERESIEYAHRRERDNLPGLDIKTIIVQGQ